MRDLLDDVHAFVDASEGGELAVQRGLRRDADEELGAVAIGLAGDADGGDDAAFVLEVAEFAGELIEAAGAPEFAGRFGVFEQGVAALDDAVGDDAVEGAAIVEALAGEGEEVLDVFRRFVGGELDAEDTEVGGDDGFEIAGGLCQRDGQRAEEESEERGAHRLYRNFSLDRPGGLSYCIMKGRGDAMNWSAIGAIFLALAVGLGAFGAHALKDRLDAYSLGIWEKAVFYHFIHSLGVLVVSLLPRTGTFPVNGASSVCWLLAAGVLIFSGSLYTLALTGVRSMGAITPIGGLCFIAAWLLLAYYFIAQRV